MISFQSLSWQEPGKPSEHDTNQARRNIHYQKPTNQRSRTKRGYYRQFRHTSVSGIRRSKRITRMKFKQKIFTQAWKRRSNVLRRRYFVFCSRPMKIRSRKLEHNKLHSRNATKTRPPSWWCWCGGEKLVVGWGRRTWRSTVLAPQE